MRPVYQCQPVSKQHLFLSERGRLCTAHAAHSSSLQTGMLLCDHSSARASHSLSSSQHSSPDFCLPCCRFALANSRCGVQEKIETVAREIYHARDVHFEELAERQLAACEAHGGGELPICMAKTQYSFSADPEAKGAPSGFTLPIRDVRVSGAVC